MATAYIESNIGFNPALMQRGGAAADLESNVGINEFLMRRPGAAEALNSNVGMPLPPRMLKPIPQTGWGVPLVGTYDEAIQPLAARATEHLNSNVVLQEEEA